MLRDVLTYRCGSLSAVGTSEDGTVAALPLFCRKWDCPDCGQWQRKRLKRRLIAGQPTSLLTLTTSPRRHQTPKEAFLRATQAINELFKALRRRYPGREIQYALVWETTKRGYPHAHILLRAPFIPQKVISALWLERTGASIVDIRQVQSQAHVAKYVSKYLTKALSVPPGYRRYRTSRLYAPAPARGTLSALLGLTTWLRANAEIPHVLSNLADHGIVLTQMWPQLWTNAQPPPSGVVREGVGMASIAPQLSPAARTETTTVDRKTLQTTTVTT